MVCNFFLASFSKIAGKICSHLNFVINFVWNVPCLFVSNILGALFGDTLHGYFYCIQVDNQIAKDSQFWLFLTILAFAYLGHSR